MKTVQQFWVLYKRELRKRKIKETALKWYVRRVQEYIEAQPEKKLSQHLPADLESYLKGKGRDRRLQSWQFYQIVHAIQILFQSVVQPHWYSEFRWEYWLSSARQLENDHDTLTRDLSIEAMGNRRTANAEKKALFQANASLAGRITKEIRRRHYSIRTEKAYLDWVIRFITFHNGRDPLKMGATEVVSFLEYLAVVRGVSASTQSQALNALIFLYNQVLKQPLEEMGAFPRAKKPRKLPVVLSVG